MDANQTQIIIVVINLVFATILAPLVKAAFSYVAAKTADVKLKTFLVDVETAVQTAVNSVNQTFVEDLKQAAEDGKLTEEEQKEALIVAIEQAGGRLTKQSIAYLEKNKVDIGEYLNDKIHEYIYANKTW